ncbi:NUDIX domain-containing protein [Candidatus Saccharibacteria bacterium]|nr:NUDIX domain-containing protein [Candidatus Saccharibacteria bacterium]
MKVVEMNFCRRCGAGLEQIAERAYRCENNHTLYVNPSPAVGVFLLASDNRVWLAVRGIEPNIGMLDSPGGFVDISETSEDAAIRELQEELGLEPGDYEPLTYLTSGYSCSNEYDGEIEPILSAFFYSRLLTDRQLQPADDVADIRLFSIDEINMDQIHAEDVRFGLEKLREMIMKANVLE